MLIAVWNRRTDRKQKHTEQYALYFDYIDFNLSAHMSIKVNGSGVDRKRDKNKETKNISPPPGFLQA